MQIFRFEWKRSQKYILIWATALAVCIFFMTPVFLKLLAFPLSFLQSLWECIPFSQDFS